MPPDNKIEKINQCKRRIQNGKLNSIVAQPDQPGNPVSVPDDRDLDPGA
jgi:hypothetical protein